MKRKVTRPFLVRIAFIDRKIREGKYPNKASLAKECCVNEKTIQRDIDALKTEYDAPIEYDARRRGFYYSSKFALSTLDLAENDFFALAVTEKVMRQYRGSPFESIFKKFYEKLSTLYEDKISLSLEELDSLLSFDIGPLKDIDKDSFSRIERAIRDKLAIEITYHGFYKDEKTIRQINPIHLKNYMGDWYLLAYCNLSKDFRIFSLNRIENIKLTSIYFQDYSSINVNEYFKDSFGIYKDNKSYNIKLKFTPYEAKWIFEKKWHNSQCVEKKKDGSIIVSFVLNNLEDIKRWVLRYGKECKVIAPAKLKDTVKSEIIGMAKSYGLKR